MSIEPMALGKVGVEVLSTDHFTSPLLQLCASFDSFHLVSHYQSEHILSHPSIKATATITKNIVQVINPLDSQSPSNITSIGYHDPAHCGDCFQDFMYLAIKADLPYAPQLTVGHF